MNFKLLLFTPLLFTSFLCAEKQENNPCLDKKKMQEKMAELTHDDASWFFKGIVKLGLLGETLKKRVQFMDKFSSLSDEEQQKKIETWLANESRKSKMLERCKRFSDYSNKKLDNETLESFDLLVKEILEDDLKNQFLCEACGDLTPSKHNKDEKFLHEFEVKFYFHKLRKKEAIKTEERKKELDELEEKALNEFKTLSDFKHYDIWHDRKTV